MPISKDTQQGINTPSHQYYFKKLTVYDFQNDIFIKSSGKISSIFKNKPRNHSNFLKFQLQLYTSVPCGSSVNSFFHS